MKLLNTLQHYDTQAFLSLVNRQVNVPLCRLFRPISKSGDGIWYLLILIAVAGHEGIEHRFVQAVLIGFLIERTFYVILKHSFKRNRPQAALNNFTSYIVPHDQFSFPSGHTSGAFLMATLGGIFWPLLMVPLFIWAACVGFSRVLLGVHFPGDVLVGAALGTGIGYLSLQLVGL